jgi:hypothetical protein
VSQAIGTTVTTPGGFMRQQLTPPSSTVASRATATTIASSCTELPSVGLCTIDNAGRRSQAAHERFIVQSALFLSRAAPKGDGLQQEPWHP